MTLAWLLAAVLAWTTGTEDEAGVAEATAIAEAILAGAERENLDPLMVAAVIAQESAFEADPCSRRVAVDRVISRTPVEGHEDREFLEWRCGSTTGTRAPCRRTVWQVEERDGYLWVDTCPAGEVGYMQVLRSSQWASAGYQIPGTDEVLSRRSSERRAQLLRPEVNIALGCAELAAHREASDMTPEDPWEDWIGSYNTGTHHGEGARRYSRTIVGRYLDLCESVIGTETGSDVRLHDVYPACVVAAELADR